MAKGWGTTKPKTSNDSARLDELVALAQLPQDEYVSMRLVGGVFTFGQHWIDIITKTGKKTAIPKLCSNWDAEEEEFVDNGCPYCEALEKKPSISYLGNAIIRDLQDAEPRKPVAPTATERKTGIKSMNSKSWTPVRVIRIPATAAKKIVDLMPLNKHGRDTYPVSDEKFGCDIDLKYDKAGSGADKYAVQKGEKSALTADEKNYLIYELDVQELPSLDESITECAKLLAMQPSDTGDGDADDSTPKRRKKTTNRKRSKTKKDDFDDAEDIGDEEDFDLDADDDDNDDDFDLDDEDDEDDADDDFDLDDEDDADDDFDLDDDDDDLPFEPDEPEEPEVKKATTRRKKSAASSDAPKKRRRLRG